MFTKLTTVTDRFLDVALQYVGCIPFDEAVRKSVKKQQPLVRAFPQSVAAKAMVQVARKVVSWPVQSSPRGHLEFFVEQLVQVSKWRQG